MAFAAYLAWAGARIDAGLHDQLHDVRDVLGEGHDEDALQLALIGALAESGWSKAIYSSEEGAEANRPAVLEEPRWWVEAVRGALEVWSPV